MNRRAQVALGLLADRVVGEPRVDPHPVALFGDVMSRAESAMWSPSRARGIAFAALGSSIGAASGAAVRSTAVATCIASSGRMLGDAALDIGDALRRDDIDGARALLPTLVGRDPSALDADEIARAVVESVAENTVDAVVAPALWAALAGAPGALGHRAVNTLDSMVGHRSPRYEAFGWASARLDDAAAWAPARATALLVAIARPSRSAAIWATVRRDAANHPSPNAGVAEAAYAAALELRLGGENRYGDVTERRADLGDGKPPSPSDIGRAVVLLRDVTYVLAGLLALSGLRAPRRR